MARRVFCFLYVLLWPLLTHSAALRTGFLPNLSQRVTSLAAMLNSWLLSDSYLISCQLIAGWHAWARFPGGPAGSYHRNRHRMIGRSPRIRTFTPWDGKYPTRLNFRSITAPFIPGITPGQAPPMNPGLCCQWPTYPRTRPSEPALANAGDVSVPFGEFRTGSGSLLCYLSRGIFFSIQWGRLPRHNA